MKTSFKSLKTWIHPPFKTPKLWKRWFNSFYPKSKNLSINILNWSILQDIPKPGGIKNIDTHLTNIIFLKALKTGKTSKAQSRNQSVLSSMTKLKKLQTKNAAHRNSWVVSRRVKKCKLPAIKAIQYEGHLCIKLEDW